MLRLVEISKDLRRDRRDRIRQIEAEQMAPPPAPISTVVIERERERPRLAERPWDEERVFEREVIYDRPPPPRREREIREREYIIR